MRQAAGPDFLCIGMQKAGTGWLFDQLQHHPDFWMPPIKEFHYFDRRFPDEKLARSIEKALGESRPGRANWRAVDERDRAFFADVEACEGYQGDFRRYASLFRHKGDLLSGDITPAYGSLPDETIGQIAEFFPSLRVILLLRDPVARAWSQICMMRRRGKVEEPLLSDVDEFRAFLRGDNKLGDNIRNRSFPTAIFERWNRHVPEGRLKWFFFDFIEKDPQRIRDDILTFLGADPSEKSGGLKAEFNRKSGQDKLELKEGPRTVLIDLFADEIRASAKLFGGYARDWETRYGL